MAYPPKDEANSTAEQAAPERLGKYPLLSVIGTGSMGVLYKSFDAELKRPVALKIIRRDLLADDGTEKFSARFGIEARAAGGLTHSGIVAVYEYGEEQGHAYIAMEFVEGRSLRECFEQKVSFTVAEAVNILSQLLEALQYAHDRGVWHRDIKPANILIMSNGQTKVTDFGIARIETSMPTHVDTIMGTPGFVAPETYLGDAFDGRIDVFAAGAVLYQLLSGTPPFAGTADKIMFKVCYETPLPPSVAARQPSLQPFDEVVMRALAKRPEDRFASAARFRAALLRAQVHAAVPGGGDETVFRPRPSDAGAPKEPISQPPAAHTLTARWNTEDLAQIEQRLARFVGPVASLMVRRAVKESTDVTSLTRWLAARISSSADREEFLKGLEMTATAAAPPRRSTFDRGTIGGRPSGTEARAQRPLTPEDMARATRLLAIYMGPIAPLVVRRAVKSGPSREEFLAALASHLSDERDRVRFLRALG
jgi:predicted Ser/Thr protein kinase